MADDAVEPRYMVRVALYGTISVDAESAAKAIALVEHELTNTESIDLSATIPQQDAELYLHTFNVRRRAKKCD